MNTTLQAILTWLSKLIAIDTTSNVSNLVLIHLIQDWYQQHDVPVRLTFDETKQKANLLATIPDSSQLNTGGLLFSGHTDVVPVTGQSWQIDPFQAVQKNNKIYGRGTSDMKGFLAVLLALLPELLQQKRAVPLHFAFSYDEEVGCKGAPLLIKDMINAGMKPDLCIVGEPTNMKPVLAHKGIQVFKCKVTGKAAHSSLTPAACNAIDYAAELIAYIRQLAEEFKQQGPFDPCYDVAFTTISTNRIQGGQANNIVPEQCEFFFEFRHLPEVNPQTIIDNIKDFAQHKVLANMRSEFSEADIEITQIGAVPQFESTVTGDFLTRIRRLTQEENIIKVAYATEAGLFQQAHIPTILCGPGKIEQAHRANEFVAVAQLQQCAEFVRRITSLQDM